MFYAGHINTNYPVYIFLDVSKVKHTTSVVFLFKNRINGKKRNSYLSFFKKTRKVSNFKVNSSSVIIRSFNNHETKICYFCSEKGHKIIFFSTCQFIKVKNASSLLLKKKIIFNRKYSTSHMKTYITYPSFENHFVVVASPFT